MWTLLWLGIETWGLVCLVLVRACRRAESLEDGLEDFDVVCSRAISINAAVVAQRRLAIFLTLTSRVILGTSAFFFFFFFFFFCCRFCFSFFGPAPLRRVACRSAS